MAQSHMDRPDHSDIKKLFERTEQSERAFMERLKERAGQARAASASMIAGGAPGEMPLEEWQANGVHVIRMPADEQGIIRISIGGGNKTPVQMNYCTFRGERGPVIDLLRKALKAMEYGEDD